MHPPSRAAMRSRQARVTASLVAAPCPIAATISVAVSSLSGLMAQPLGFRPLLARAALNHTLVHAHTRERSHAQEANQLREISKPNGTFPRRP